MLKISIISFRYFIHTLVVYLYVSKIYIKKRRLRITYWMKSISPTCFSRENVLHARRSHGATARYGVLRGATIIAARLGCYEKIIYDLILVL